MAMTIIALIFTPFVLAYQAWSYWVFRQRIRRPGEEIAPEGVETPSVPASTDG